MGYVMVQWCFIFSGNTTIQVIIDENINGISIEDIKSTLKGFLDSIGSVSVVKIPSTVPLTRGQYGIASQYWPVNFYENKM